MSWIPAAIGAIGGIIGGNMRNDAQAAQAAAANQFSAQQFASRYQTTVKDMLAAGLSPMLAYGQGGGSPPSGQQGQMQDVVTPAIEAGTHAYSASQSAKLIEAQVDTQKANADLASAQAAKVRAETHYVPGISEADIGVKLSSAELNKRQLDQVDATVAKIRTEIPKIQGDTNFDAQQRILQHTARLVMENATIAQAEGSARAQLLNQTIKKLVAETDLKNLDLDAARSLGNIGREAGQLGPIIQLIIQAIRAAR